MENPEVLVITLQETPWRTFHCSKHLSTRKVEARLIRGIHAYSFGVKSTAMRGGGNHISQGLLGMQLSHMIAWSVCDNLPGNEFIILEDDAVLVENFWPRFHEARAALPQDWDIAFLGMARDPNSVKSINDYVGKWNVRDGHAYGTHAMLVRKSSLPLLRDTNNSAEVAIDQQISERTLPHCNHYVFKPYLATQISAYGDWISCAHDGISAMDPNGRRHNDTHPTFMSYTYIDGDIHLYEMYWELVRCSRDGDIFVEVGSQNGKSAAYLASLFSLNCMSPAFCSVDPADREAFHKNLRGFTSYRIMGAIPWHVHPGVDFGSYPIRRMCISSGGVEHIDKYRDRLHKDYLSVGSELTKEQIEGKLTELGYNQFVTEKIGKTATICHATRGSG